MQSASLSKSIVSSGVDNRLVLGYLSNRHFPTRRIPSSSFLLCLAAKRNWARQRGNLAEMALVVVPPPIIRTRFRSTFFLPPRPPRPDLVDFGRGIFKASALMVEFCNKEKMHCPPYLSATDTFLWYTKNFRISLKKFKDLGEKLKEFQQKLNLPEN